MARRLIIISFIYLIIAFLTYKDFGVTADEQVEYESGRILLNYIKTGEEPEDPLVEKRHLPTQSIYFRGHLALFNLLNPEFSYEKFHLFNIILALPIFLMFYMLLFSRYKRDWIAGLGTLALFLTPRFTGDIPANPKDVPFAVFFFLSLGFIYFFSKLKSHPAIKILILGFLFGITSAFRLPGLTLFAIYLFYAIYVEKNFKFTYALPIFLVAAAVFIKSMPIFSTGIIEGLRVLSESAANFGDWNNKMLFMGEFITKDERPAVYLPVWFLITTPLFILIPFVLSPIVYFKEKVKDGGIYILMFLALAINFALYLLLSPVIYNGLRHFLFLVPIVTFVGVLAFFDSYSRWLKPKLFVMSILILLTPRSVISLHPYQYVYFNELVGGLRGASGRFDSDYWGASYRESSIWAKENLSQEGGVDVFACDMAWAVEYYSDDKFRLTGELEEADYIICDFDNVLQGKFDHPAAFKVERDGVPLNVVMKGISIPVPRSQK